jgi:hypothetical protein
MRCYQPRDMLGLLPLPVGRDARNDCVCGVAERRETPKICAWIKV